MSTTLCTKCGQSCGEAEYIIHVANDCQTVKCPKCPKFYSNEEYLLKHTRAVHDKEFSCTICQIEYASKYNLKRHMASTHKQIDTDKFKCEECDEFFVTKYVLKRHIQQVHNREFVCTLCAEECVSFYALKAHMRRKHSDAQVSVDGRKIFKVAKVECPKCGRRIAKTYLERHFRITHNKKTFTCHVCDREFTSEKALEKHIEYRHGEEYSAEVLLQKKYKCPECPQRFQYESTLRMHIKGIHEERYKCEVCGKLFTSPSHLIRHRTNVHGLIEYDNKTETEKQASKKYKCPQCSQRFTASWTLKTHIKGKHEQQFQCDVCEKYFSAPFPLLRHRRGIHGLTEDNELKEQDSKIFEKDVGAYDDLDADEDNEDYSNDLPLAALEIKMETDEKDQESASYSYEDGCFKKRL